VNTYEDCPDVAAHAERAKAYSAARFGDRKSLGRRQAIDLVRVGWGVGQFATMSDIGRAFDAAIGTEVQFSHTATFAVTYNLPPGHSAGGSSQGARPVSVPMFTRESVYAWGELALIRFACTMTEADHYG
jgi:hypothetical protein